MSTYPSTSTTGEQTLNSPFPLTTPYPGTTPLPGQPSYASSGLPGQSPFPGQAYPGQPYAGQVPQGYGPSPYLPPTGPPRRPGPSRSMITASAVAAVLLVLAVVALTVAVTVTGSRGEDSADSAVRAASVSEATDPAAAQPAAAPTTASTDAAARPISQPAPIDATPVTSAPVAVAPRVTTPVVAASQQQPTYSNVDVSPGRIAARFDEYLAAGSGFDVDRFAGQWAYPIQSYYGNRGASRSFVIDKAQKYFAKHRSITFTRVGAPQISVDGNVVHATAPFSYQYLNQDGTSSCGTNTLTIGFNRTDGLPISSISETQGPKGCGGQPTQSSPSAATVSADLSDEPGC